MCHSQPHVRCRRLLAVWFVASLAVSGACNSDPPPELMLGSLALPASIQKTYPRKIFVHLMPWFRVGGQHWSMNARNSATGIASWYTPLIGEYSSDDGNVIEYQLLTMKYAGIDGVLLDWPGLSGAYDLPQNKAASDAIINRTAAFGLEFGVVYEDQNAASVDAAKSDMTYVRDNFFSRPNHLKVNGAPALLVFGPQRFKSAGEWSNILSVFAAKPAFFSLWYNDAAGSNNAGRFAWIAQNGLKGVLDFNDGLDGADHGLTIPVLYPGFNPYYAAGGWPGPAWKISYGLKKDNSEGGDTFQSTFELGKYAGEPLQIATWNDYGEGTMVEPTQQFQYRFLTTLQNSVGAVYTETELKIVKQLFDQRRQFGASKQAALDQASAALARLDVATACGILGCAAPVHPGTGGVDGSMMGTGGRTGTAGSSGTGGTAKGTGGRAGAGGSGGSAGRPADAGGGQGAGGSHADNGLGGCATGGAAPASSLAFLIAAALAMTGGHRARRGWHGGRREHQICRRPR